MGGLVVNVRVRPVGEDAGYLRAGLAQVQRVSGRAASDRYFDDIGTWVSSSEPVCRAALVAIELGGQDAGFEASHHLSDRMYVQGREPDSIESIRDLADTLGVDGNTFIDRWTSPEAHARLQEHWTDTRRTGLQTYPTIAVRTTNGISEMLTGFADTPTIVQTIEEHRRRKT